MAAHRLVLGMVLVAGLAYGAGRYGVGADPSSLAAQPQPDTKKQPEGKPPALPPGLEEAMKKAGTPGENHKVLDVLIGDWDASVKMWMTPDSPPMESKGPVTRKWILEKRFIQEDVEAPSFDGTSPAFRGLGFTGYNNTDKKYEMVWLDNHNTAIMNETGTYDPATKILRTTGTCTDPTTGKQSRTRGEANLSNPDKHTYVAYRTGPDGKEFKAFEGTMERRKK